MAGLIKGAYYSIEFGVNLAAILFMFIFIAYKPWSTIFLFRLKERKILKLSKILNNHNYSQSKIQ